MNTNKFKDHFVTVISLNHLALPFMENRMCEGLQDVCPAKTQKYCNKHFVQNFRLETIGEQLRPLLNVNCQ